MWRGGTTNILHVWERDTLSQGNRKKRGKKPCLDVLASAVLVFILSYTCAHDSKCFFLNPGVRPSSGSGTRLGRGGVESFSAGCIYSSKLSSSRM